MSLVTIHNSLYNWVSGQLQAVDSVVWSFNVDLITGNSIVVTLNGSDFAAVPFNTDNDTTMDDIATALANEAAIATAVVSGTAPNQHTISLTGATGTDVVINMVTVTGGADQAVLQTNLRQKRSSVPVDQVIWENNNAPRPDDEPYVTLKTSAFMPVGTPHIEALAAPDPIPALGSREVDELDEFTLTINAFSGDTEGKIAPENTFQRILNLIRSIQRELEVQNEFARANIGFVDVLATDDISGLLDTVIERRAFCDIRFRTSDAVSEDVALIETFEFDGDLNT